MSTKHERSQAVVMTLSRPAVIATSLVAVGVLSVLFRVWGALVTDDALGIIRSQLTFTVDRFADVTGTWNIAEFIRLTATLDFVYPIAYATAIGGVWARAAGPDHWRGSAWPIMVAFGAAGADWLENTFHLLAIEPAITAETPITAFVAVGSVFAAIKWIGVVVALTAAAGAAWKHDGWRWRLIAAACASLSGAIAGVVLTTAI